MVRPERFHPVLVTSALIALAACRHHDRPAAVRPTHAAAPAPVVTPALPAPPLFGSSVASQATLIRWSESRRLLGPFFTAVDGSLAVMAPDGTLRWLSPGPNGAVSHEAHTPCRFDPSRHGTLWTISPRIALDGAGHACCVHDGNEASTEGVYCGDLSAPESWRRAHTQIPATGVGSGAHAIAMFHNDVWCTTDGGAHMATTFRGDESQIVTVASCDVAGRAVAVVGTRAPGGVQEQTIRFAAPGGGLALLADTPRGEPIDARMLDDGSMAVLLGRTQGPALVTRAPDGTVHTLTLDLPPALALGAWGDHTVLVRSGATLRAVDAHTGAVRQRIIDTNGPSMTAASRVGRELGGASRDGAFGMVTTD